MHSFSVALHRHNSCITENQNDLSVVHIVTGSVRRSLVGAKTARDAVYTTRHVDTYCLSLASTVWRTRPSNNKF